uniref:Uncharacterized protein n=1 Tax=Micrurus spixii TaxID=129469 RepID=A0A2D4M9R5_9SAUR
MRMNEDTGAQKEGENVCPVWVVIHGGYQMLDEDLQGSRNEIPILENRIATPLACVWCHLSSTSCPEHAGKYRCLWHSFPHGFLEYVHRFSAWYNPLLTYSMVVSA